MYVHFSLHLSNTWPLPSDNSPSSFSSVGESRLFNSASIDSFLSLRPGLDSSSDRTRPISSNCLPANWGPPLSVRPHLRPDIFLFLSIFLFLLPVVWAFLTMVCLKVPPTHTLTPSGVGLPHHGLPQGTTNTH